MLLAFFDLVFLILMLPFLLLRLSMTVIYDWLSEVCEPRVFLTGVWAGLCGAFLLTVDEPDPSAPFVTVTERLVAVSLGPVTLPYLFIIAAVCITMASFLMRLRQAMEDESK
jgi:branched-subunit amino acid ABC-type transport system permease component